MFQKYVTNHYQEHNNCWNKITFMMKTDKRQTTISCQKEINLQTRRSPSQAGLLFLQLLADSSFLHFHFHGDFHRPFHDLLHDLRLNFLDVVCWNVALLPVSPPSTPPIAVRLLYQLQLLCNSDRQIPYEISYWNLSSFHKRIYVI